MQTAAGAAPAPPCDVKHVVLLQCSHASNPPFLVGYCCLCRKPHHADAKPEHPKPADPKPEHAKPADSKPEHAKPDAKPLQDLLPLQDLAKLSLEDASDLADAKPEETEAGVDPFAKKKRTAFKLVDQNVVAQQQAPWSQANLQQTSAGGRWDESQLNIEARWKKKKFKISMLNLGKLEI